MSDEAPLLWAKWAEPGMAERPVELWGLEELLKEVSMGGVKPRGNQCTAAQQL